MVGLRPRDGRRWLTEMARTALRGEDPYAVFIGEEGGTGWEGGAVLHLEDLGATSLAQARAWLASHSGDRWLFVAVRPQEGEALLTLAREAKAAGARLWAYLEEPLLWNGRILKALVVELDFDLIDGAEGRGVVEFGKAALGLVGQNRFAKWA